MVYPFFNTFAISVATADEAPFIGLILFPSKVTFDSYKKVLSQQFMFNAYANTIFRTAVGTVLSTFLCFSVAYVLSKKKLPYRNIITIFFLFTMFFSGGLIPFYILMRSIKLINSLWALIIPSLYSVWNIVIMRNYISTIPEEMEEAAVVDGAHPLYIIFMIMLPLSLPIVATVSLWNAVGHWNAWFDAMIYITDGKKQVLQMILRKIVIMEEMRHLIPEMDAALTSQGVQYTELTVKAATIMLTIGPIIAAYPFAQKYFVKGILIGSLKG